MIRPATRTTWPTLGASTEYQVAQGAVFQAVLKSGTNQILGRHNGLLAPPMA